MELTSGAMVKCVVESMALRSKRYLATHLLGVLGFLPSKDHLSSRNHVTIRGGDESPGSTLSFTRGGEHVL